VLYDSRFYGTGDGDSGNRDEIVATGMANTWKSIHLCGFDVRSLLNKFKKGYYHQS
jgi:hypothetical protein